MKLAAGVFHSGFTGLQRTDRCRSEEGNRREHLGVECAERGPCGPQNDFRGDRCSGCLGGRLNDLGNHSPLICLVAAFRRLNALIAAIATTSAASWGSL